MSICFHELIDILMIAAGPVIELGNLGMEVLSGVSGDKMTMMWKLTKMKLNLNILEQLRDKYAAYQKYAPLIVFVSSKCAFICFC
jgi:hypothetical protein